MLFYVRKKERGNGWKADQGDLYAGSSAGPGDPHPLMPN
jgi:hypothetical protein